ncbi:MAG: glycerophosphodiester phosphodiesterase family protein, partial [Vicinamibacterales bacterium]
MKVAGIMSAVVLVLVAISVVAAQGPRKMLVAHRGTSAYAPEHTLAAYRLAIEQRADFVEQDLQISKDGVLVCLHDLTL